MFLVVLLLFVWGLGIEAFVFRMRPHLRKPDEKEFFGLLPRGIYLLDFFTPSLFTDEGNRIRRIGVWWVVLGAAAQIATLCAL